MIVSVTPNPSVDRTIAVPGVRRGAVLRATNTWHEPSGKGVNVSIALAAHGHPTRAVLPIGGPEGDRLSRMLAAAGIDFHPVRITGEVRSNVSLAEPGGTVTKINELGPRVSAEEGRELITATLDAADGADWIAGCGSLPPGAPDDFFAELCAARRRHGRVAVDSSGAPLRAALDGKPDLVKPNGAELADATGSVITTIGQALDASEKLLHAGAGQVLTSLGRDGALLVTGSEATYGEVAIERPRSSVGAGDALLAGFLAAGAAGPDALAGALDWAGAAVSAPGTLFDRARVSGRWSVHIHDRPDPDRPLTDHG